MNKFIVTALVLLLASPALADPGVGEWVDTNGENTFYVGAGGTVSYAFTTAVNSKVIAIKANRASICFDTDTSTAVVGAARISVYLSLAIPGEIDDSDRSIALPAIPFDGSDCLDVTIGRYWIEVDTPRAASETPRVRIAGRGA